MSVWAVESPGLESAVYDHIGYFKRIGELQNAAQLDS